MPRRERVYADSQYRAGYLHEAVFSFAPFTLAVVSRPEGVKGWVRLPQRWVVERTISWLARCRGILIRWEKKAANYLGLLKLACALLWFRRYHRLTHLR